jgi:hypothetical protein
MSQFCNEPAALSTLGDSRRQKREEGITRRENDMTHRRLASRTARIGTALSLAGILLVGITGPARQIEAQQTSRQFLVGPPITVRMNYTLRLQCCQRG